MVINEGKSGKALKIVIGKTRDKADLARVLVFETSKDEWHSFLCSKFLKKKKNKILLLKPQKTMKD